MQKRLQWCSEATSDAQWAPAGVLSRTYVVYKDDFSDARRPLPLCTASPLWALVGSSSLSLSAFCSMITYTRRVSMPRRSSYIVEELCVCPPPNLQTSAEGADPGGVGLCDSSAKSPWLGRGGSPNLLTAARPARVVSRPPDT